MIVNGCGTRFKSDTEVPAGAFNDTSDTVIL